MHNKILLVDDEAFVLFSLRRMLKQYNIEVEVETDPIQALEKIKNNDYKLVVSDFKMPVLDGGKFLELVYNINPKIKKVILSAHVDQKAFIDLVNKVKIDKIFYKPWNEKEIVNTINDLMTDPTITLEHPISENQKTNIKIDESNDNLLLPDNKSLYNDIQLKEVHNLFDYLIGLTSQKISLHSKRVAQLLAYFGKYKKMSKEDIESLYIAGLYHDMGKLFELVSQSDHQEISYNILNQFKNFESSAKLVKNHHIIYSSQKNEDLKLYMISLVDDFDKLINKKLEFNEKPLTPIEIFVQLETMKNEKYHPEVFDDFKRMMLVDLKLVFFTKEIKITLLDLEENQFLSRPIFTESGKMLLNSEFTLTKDIIIRLFDHNKTTPIKQPIYIYEKKPEKSFNLMDLLKKS